MSRVGQKPIPIPSGVSVSLVDSAISVEGPKGKLAYTFPEPIKANYDAAARSLSLTRADDERQSKALHGLARSLVANMVAGVTAGYTKKLEIVGVGYQAQLAASTLVLQVGFANQIKFPVPPGISAVVPDPTHITINGIDKQAVGQFAAEIRRSRPPEPYKGKGIRYEGEVVRRKAGKAFGAK